jgi:cyclopropane-fatty-acyl-phospholipid synthase
LSKTGHVLDSEKKGSGMSHPETLAPPVAAAPELKPAIDFLECAFPAPREFAIRLADGTELPAQGHARFTLVIPSPSVLRAMFRPPVETSLGDAYISGAVQVEGDLTAVFPIVEACRRAVRSPRELLALARLWRALPRADDRMAGATAAARLSGQLHSRQRDSQAVRFHYDLGNDFYSLFLDSRMVYSCAYYPTGREDLETAQALKLDHICRKLRLQPGERMLDIGCGWGGLLIYAAQRYGIRGIGVTLSEQQHELAQRRIAELGLADRIEVRLADYRTLDGEEFDKASSISMFEHLGFANLPAYFARVHSLVKPGGLFLNHGITNHAIQPRKGVRGILMDPLNRLLVGTSPIARAVFPDTELRPVSEVNLVAERANWEVRDVENLREHYAQTGRHWMERMQAREEEAVRVVGAPTYRTWLLYFVGNVERLDRGRVSLTQTLLARLDARGRAHIPMSRGDIYT